MRRSRVKAGFARLRRMMLLPAGLVLLAVQARPGAALGSVERINVSSAGAQADTGVIWGHSISSDGRYIAFDSQSTNLVADDTNGVSDVFVHDRATKETTRVSVSSSGVQADGHSEPPMISADGRFVAYSSAASNLVAGDATYFSDVFVFDRLTGTTEMVSLSSAGTQLPQGGSRPSISGDGRYIAFEGRLSTTEPSGILVRDRVLGMTFQAVVSQMGARPDGGSRCPAISADGSTVAFVSEASNLVPGDTNGIADLFIRDLSRQTTERINVSSDGAQANSFLYCINSGSTFSHDGRYVVFASDASSLVLDDTNGTDDVFLRDRQLQTTERISLGSFGQLQAPSALPSISADGRYVSFSTGERYLIPQDTNQTTDVFIRDRLAGVTRPVSLTADGAVGNRESYPGQISGDGRVVAFGSQATNFVPNDTNGIQDLFVRELTYPEGRPTLTVLSPQRAPEGTETIFDLGSFSTGGLPGPWLTGWDWGDGSRQPRQVTGSPAVGSYPHLYVEDGTYTATITVTDPVGGYDRHQIAVEVYNLAPVFSDLSAVNLNPIPINTAFPITAGFSDRGREDLHTARIDWGDGTTEPGQVSESGSGYGRVEGTHTYSEPGLYRVAVTARDDEGAEGTVTYPELIVYGYEGAFAGGGSVDSPPGAFRADPTLAGRARFSASVRYRAGEQTPSGQTRFHFPAAGLTLTGQEYDWLVDAGETVVYQGTGQLNGAGHYRFRVRVTARSEGGGVADVRIRIWEKYGYAVVYDSTDG